MTDPSHFTAVYLLTLASFVLPIFVYTFLFQWIVTCVNHSESICVSHMCLDLNYDNM